MKVFITGGGGFLGNRLAHALLARGRLSRTNGESAPITQVKCFDLSFSGEADARIVRVTGDIGEPGVLARAMDRDTAAVFHLAAVVSGGAEADFDLGMRVNLDGTRYLLEACRTFTQPPKLVFTSSVAAFGGEMPEVLDDSTTPNPQTSYGMQKVAGEYLIADYTRKGFIDGRCLRLPTIVVRPGKPNLAASSFASGIVREPLNGEVSQCPVAESTGVWLLSPTKVVDAFVHAHELPSATWGVNRVVNLPGITVSVKEMVAALAKVAGDVTAARVRFVPEARIEGIVKTWPARFKTERALKMGFAPDTDFETVIRDYIAEQRIKL